MRSRLRTALRDEVDRARRRGRRRGCPARALPGVRPSASTSNGMSYANTTRNVSTTMPAVDVSVPRAPVDDEAPNESARMIAELDRRVDEAGDEP